jgi:type IV secretory pathway VirD2 relaxase
MTRDDDLRVRIGRIRDTGSARRAKPFIAQALAAAEKAGGLHRRSGRGRSAAFGRGRAASLAATRLVTNRTRSVTVKARIVWQRTRGAALSAHLAYLRREGVTKDGGAGRLFDAEHDDADHRAFAERCEGDRHHFRFIVSPQDAERLSDLKGFTRDLMAQAERDLGTNLDWLGIEHWNTDNPHIHVIVRGKGHDGHDLVMARDYISQGLRARAANLATLELGPRSDLEIRRDLDAQVEADRWTRLDRALAREAARNDGIIDLRPGVDARTEAHARTAMIGRMQKLERLGLAEALTPAQWRLSEDAEPVMRALGERNDIIKRIHRGLADQRIERNIADFALDGGDATPQLIGRLVARGLDDELKGTATPLSTESTDALTIFAWPTSTLRATPRRAASSSSASSRMPLAVNASPWRCVPTCPSTRKSRPAAPPGSTANLSLVNRTPSVRADSAARSVRRWTLASSTWLDTASPTGKASA